MTLKRETGRLCLPVTLAVLLLVVAVLILAMGSGIKQDGAVSILSIIAGYVLSELKRGFALGKGGGDASGAG